MDSLTFVLGQYGIEGEGIQLLPLTNGLINKTWKVVYGRQQFVLQCINKQVFGNPQDLASNVRMIAQYLKSHSPSYRFISQIKSKYNEEVVVDGQGSYFRLFPFVTESHALGKASSPDHAFEAALQFGKFTKLLSGFDLSKLHLTIPHFHNLTLRYKQFENALMHGNKERIKQADSWIAKIRSRADMVVFSDEIKKNPQIKQRVMHHDTKISNVLFDAHGKGICVIDLDTVMPGYFTSDLGDMMRTYLSAVSEEESDYDRIDVREDYFRAVVQGYISTMGNELTSLEKDLIFYSGRFMIYMQSLRFLTDYCSDDVYYGASYSEQNLVRTGNQLKLLEKWEEKERLLQEIIAAELKVNPYFSM